MIKLRQSFKHDKMASRHKRLMCHYCNSKSDLIYDGKITHWECGKCDAVNYLDENGEITDPVVSSDSPAPPPTRYASASSSEPLNFSHDSNIFCNICLKNQHLYTSSLAQYHADVDVENSEDDSNDAYNKFRRDLERRYPQVCEKCEPAALQRLKKAGRTAKADHLWRLMEKSRAGQFNKTNNFIFITDLLGKTLWKIGLSGQIVWSFMTILHTTFPDIFSQSESTIYGASPKYFNQVITITTSRKWAYSVLLCTILSIWWCPKYKEFNKGSTKKISGLRSWYLLQVAVIFLRISFYLMMDSRLFPSDPFSPVTTGAHLLMPLLIILISTRATDYLKVTKTPLWVSDSEKMSLRPQTRSLDEEQESMDDILNHIALSSKTSQEFISNTSEELSVAPNKISPLMLQTSYDITKNPLMKNSLGSQEVNIQSTELELNNPPNNHYSNPGLSSRFHDPVKASAHLNTSTQKPLRITPFLADMSEQEVSSYLQTRKLPDRLTYEEMDWQSTQDHIHTFNLNKTGIPHVNNKPNSHDPHPFWCKVPAAPTTPARKLWNPPNQLNFQKSQKKAHPIFFQSVAQTSLDHSKKTIQSKLQNGGNTKHNLELSQPKFFPPETRSESEIMLADLLDDFSLNGTESKKKHPSSSTNFSLTTHSFLLAGATLIFSFAFYFLCKVV